MLRGSFRPWGVLSWVLDRLTESQWDFVGCISTEERCLTSYLLMNGRNQLKERFMFEIHDEPSPETVEIQALLQKRKQDYLNSHGNNSHIHTYRILERQSEFINRTQTFVANSCGNIILDVSSLPKRFFFPIVKVLIQSENIRNIIITYTIPERYAEQPLAQDPEPWNGLPMFLPPYPEPDKKALIVGLGYEPLGLHSLLEGEEFRNVPMSILFPFPSLPPGIARNWEFLRNLERDLGGKPLPEAIRVNTHDVSEVFDRIVSITRQGERFAIFAPYGPKPVSLAMCLYAVSKYSGKDSSAVYYTQPKFYHPYYSSGVRQTRYGPAAMAYCIRLNGANLY